MLAEQQAVWAAYPADLKAQLHVIIVDDGSPKESRPGHKAILETGLASDRLYRMLKDVRWNWLACRNLGVDQAETEWVLLTDIDHVLPEETLHRLVHGDLSADRVYRLSRADAPHPWPYQLRECKAYKIHPNTWLMTRAMYDRIGGYDERLSGCYGTDGEFRDRVHEQARSVVTLPHVLIRYPREIIADASTTVFTRKNDPINDDDLIRRREQRARVKGWRPLRLTFPWERVC
jgi:glycosyltransferase involved in cell wall biosynthesis